MLRATLAVAAACAFTWCGLGLLAGARGDRLGTVGDAPVADPAGTFSIDLTADAPPLAGFHVQTRRGRLDADPRHTVAGNVSLRITTDGSGAQVNVRRTLAPALDLRGHHLVVTILVDDPTALERADLYLSSDGFEGHEIHPLARRLVSRSQNPVRPGAWVSIPVTLGTPVATVGSIDLQRISDIQVAVADAGERPVRLWIGDIVAVPRPARGVLSIVFDDARDGVGTHGAATAARHGLRASVAVIRDLLGEPGFMSIDELRVLVHDLGWDVVAHHATDLAAGFDTLDDPTLDAELAAVRSWMRDMGLGAGAHHVTYPMGGFDPRVVDRVRALFRSARTIVPGHETLPPADPHLIRSISVTPRHGPDVLRREVDRAARDRTWLVLTFHQIVDREPQFDTEYAAVDFEAFAAYVAASDVDVRTVPEVMTPRLR